MEGKTRTEYSARNTTVALISRLTAIAMGYALRVVFTHNLSKSYVGVNGLFVDIIQVLSLSEMGIGTAITYALYRPIAQGDIEKQRSLMHLFRKFYLAVAAIVAVAGGALIPFMGYFIKDYENVDHLTLIYVLYLANTICSYLLIYKKTLMDANQLLYIGTFYQTMSWVIQDILQMAVLIIRHDFILFLLINIATTILCNVCISLRADRLYPFLKEKNPAPLPTEEKKKIFSDIRAMLMHKVSAVIVNNTDNLLLSAFVGLSSVASYSNYYLVIGSVRQMLNQVYQGITASVGNLGVTEKEDHIREVFEAVLFIGQWMYGFAFICLFEALNPFIRLSFGDQYVFPEAIVFVLCLNFFMNGMRNAALTFRDSMGLFWHDRHKAIAEAVANIVISLLLVRRMGTVGVFLGTFLSMLLTSFWVEPYVLYKYGFKKSCGGYFLRYFAYVAVIGIGWAASDWLCGAVSSRGLPLWQELAARLVICAIVPNLWFLAVYWRTKEFRFLRKKAASLISRMRKKSPGRASDSTKNLAEKALLGSLAAALNAEGPEDTPSLADCLEPVFYGGDGAHSLPEGEKEGVFREMTEIARKHAVLPLLAGLSFEGCPQSWEAMVLGPSKVTVRTSYRLLFLTKYVTHALGENGIRAIVLKGAATASYYPVPELRKSGDVDILIPDPSSFRRAEEILESEGFARREEQLALHHVELVNDEGISVELHSMLAEPFESGKMNRFLEGLEQRYQSRIVQNEAWGVPFLQPSDAYHAFYLLVHMLQHFLRAGFGLKFLCDWAVFWNHGVSREDRQEFRLLAKESGTDGFARVLDAACIECLGLRPDAAAFPPEDAAASRSLVREFMEDVFGAGEFGHDDGQRMVAMRGTGIFAYVREFHHQMRLNYPTAGKFFPLWPVLWILTLARFLHNNRAVRKVKGREILKKAGNRSRLIGKMKLFS